MQIIEQAKAKINLSLDILHKRPDGYHEVEMIMQTIDLSDQLTLTARDDEKITVQTNSGYLPLDSRNIAYKAAEALRRKYNIQQGVSIKIDKKIPVAAGLAGGSSNAAATLRALNRLWGLNLSLEDLALVGAEIGSDVPFCIYGGTALATGRGEIIRQIDPLPTMLVILVKPPIGVSTSLIYEKFNIDKVELRPDTQGLLKAIKDQDRYTIYAGLANVLESVTLDLYPVVRTIKEDLIKAGTNAVLMSGSGPTVYGLVHKEKRARNIINGLQDKYKEIYLARTCN